MNPPNRTTDWVDLFGQFLISGRVKFKIDPACCVLTFLAILADECERTIRQSDKIFRETASKRAAVNARYYRHARSYLKHAYQRALHSFDPAKLTPAIDRAYETLLREFDNAILVGRDNGTSDAIESEQQQPSGRDPRRAKANTRKRKTA